MLDSHCHLDRYKSARLVATEASGRGVFVVAMTNLPSHFREGLPHTRPLRRVRLALGLHPLAASYHRREIRDFEHLFPTTSFIGEVGLDFSNEGKGTANRQLESFDRIVRLLRGSRKFVSVHSRRAETDLLDILARHNVTGVVFHWYSGTVATLERILRDGHFLSINPAMIRSHRGEAIIRRIPCDRLLTETDGPYCRVNNAPAHPWHVKLVENYVSRLWKTSPTNVREQVWSNFRRILNSPANGSGQPSSPMPSSISS